MKQLDNYKHSLSDEQMLQNTVFTHFSYLISLVFFLMNDKCSSGFLAVIGHRVLLMNFMLLLLLMMSLLIFKTLFV